MTNNQYSKFNAQSNKDETVLVVGMIRIVYHAGILVKEYRLRLVEGCPVLLLICCALFFVPIEGQMSHIYIVNI
ncbi:MAG: hypothetical protein A2072_03020 [Nitrospirae bacterium GWC1_57_7]|nr:MAG: hypothetical protein A2072_03020 [Nitrospirae bacterium GWC1_57_7]